MPSSVPGPQATAEGWFCITVESAMSLPMIEVPAAEEEGMGISGVEAEGLPTGLMRR